MPKPSFKEMYEELEQHQDSITEASSAAALDKGRDLKDLLEKGLDKLDKADMRVKKEAAKVFQQAINLLKGLKESAGDEILDLNEKKKAKAIGYKISSQGKGEMKVFRIQRNDGSELIDMEFDSEDAAKKYAKKKGLKLKESEGGTLDEKLTQADAIDAAKKAWKAVDNIEFVAKKAGIGLSQSGVSKLVDDCLKKLKTIEDKLHRWVK